MRDFDNYILRDKCFSYGLIRRLILCFFIRVFYYFYELVLLLKLVIFYYLLLLIYKLWFWFKVCRFFYYCLFCLS